MADLTGSTRAEESHRRRIVLRCALGIAFLLGIPVDGQSPYPQFPSTNNGRVHYPDATGSYDTEKPLDERRLRELNLQRQKEIVSDTAKLLRLARELNDEITDAETPMTDTQVRKVAEIGKLAKTVKEKMSYSVGGGSAFRSPVDSGIQ